MSGWLDEFAKMLAVGGSLLAFATVIQSYISHAKLIKRAKGKISPNDTPIVEDESVDPSFEDNDKGDIRGRGDE